MSNSNDLKNLQPGATYTVQIVPKNTGNDAEGKVSSINYTFTVPTTYGGSALQSLNSVVTQFIDGTGALVSGSGGGPLSPSSTMFIDGAGLKAFNNIGDRTVYISSEDGNAFFSGSIQAKSGSIGGWYIGDKALYAGTGNSFVGMSSDPTVSSKTFFAGASSSAGNTASFYVTNAGNMFAQSASFNGTLTAPTIISGSISAQSASFGFSNSGQLVGGAIYVPDKTNPTFKVDGSGNMVANSASISGSIVANSGYIGGPTGWAITSGSIRSGGGSGSIILDGVGNKITIGAGNFGSLDTGFYVDSAGQFSLSNQLTFRPGRGSASTIYISSASLSTTSYVASTTFNNTGSAIVIGSLITGNEILVDTYVSSVTYGTNAFLTLNNYPSSNIITASLTVLMEDYSELNIAGKIRGIVESIKPIASPKLFSLISSASINSSSTQVLFGTSGHAFAAGEKLILEGLPSNLNLNKLNYTASSGNSYVVASTPNSTSVVINIPSGSVNNGAVGGISGSISIQELTMGFHPIESASTNASSAYFHNAGTGIRLDKYNWWLTNNQFRVGNPSSYFKYDGTQFKIQGGNSKYILLQVGGTDAANQIAITSNSSGSYNDTNTPFYADGLGQFSLGQKLKFDTSGNLSISGSIIATAGYIGGTTNGWSINSGCIQSTGGTSKVTLDGANGKIYIGTGTAGNSNTAFYADGTGSVTIKDRLIFDGTNLSISGSVVASSGSIGNWQISSGSLSAGIGTSAVGLIPNATAGGVAIFAGNSTPLSAPFYVTNSGSLVATTASIKGTINGLTVALKNSNNTAIGDTALNSLTVSGNYNTAIGSSAMYNTTSGDNNIAIGYQTLYSNTTGLNNVAIGPSAMYSGLSISTAVAIGYQAMSKTTIGTYSVAIGYQALFNQTIGSQNYAIGFQALYGINSGANNVAIGDGAGFNITSGAGNVCIGNAADSSTNAINTIAIGSNATASYNNSIAIGAAVSTTSTYDFVLGNTSHTVRIPGTFKSEGTFITEGATTINRTGGSAVNTNIYGRVALVDMYNYTTTGTANTLMLASPQGMIYRISSTYRIKDQIFPLSSNSTLINSVPIEKIINNPGFDPYNILNITPVSFRSMEEIDNGKRFLGFIAEDIAEKVPEVATYDKNGEPEYYSVNGIVSALLAVVQDQQKRIESLESAIIN